MEFDPSLWLTTLRAVPAIGIHTRPTFESGVELLSTLRPLVQKWQGDSNRVDVELDPLGLKINGKDGFLNVVTQTFISTGFVYKGEMIQDGALPTLKFSSEIQPIGVLVTECKTKVLQLLSEVQKKGQREIELIGIVVSGFMSRTSPPPGVDAFINYLASPWGETSAPSANLTFQVNLEKGDGWQDACHHSFNWNETSPSIGFKLDWQRIFEKAKQRPNQVISNELDTCIAKAFQYFQTFGMGNLAYE